MCHRNQQAVDALRAEHVDILLFALYILIGHGNEHTVAKRLHGILHGGHKFHEERSGDFRHKNAYDLAGFRTEIHCGVIAEVAHLKGLCPYPFYGLRTDIVHIARERS